VRRVPGLAIYALFSDGGDTVPEKNHVTLVVWYNTVCAKENQAKCDVVAVNNENWSNDCSPAQMVAYLLE